MKGKSIWAVFAGVLFTIVVPFLVDYLMHATAVLPQCWLGGKLFVAGKAKA